MRRILLPLVALVLAGLSTFAVRIWLEAQRQPTAVAAAKEPEPPKPVEQPAPVVAAVSDSGGPAIIKVPRDTPAPQGKITVSDPSAVNFNPRTAHLPDRALI